MREPKFKFWLKDQKKMTNAYTLKELLDGGWYDIPSHDICEFTGLLDKHGKEIYEGDIVKDWQSGGVSKVEWIRTSWQLVNPKNKWGAYCSRLNVLEVIGNTHEHPHLLKDNQN